MINVAIDAARQAGQLALAYFKSPPKVSYKPDNSPVTRADREAEQLIRKIIAKKFPDHGIIGEEYEPVTPQARIKWVIDPIDGTKEFVRGIKTWCTLLAVLENDKPIIGIAYYPYDNELFCAQKNSGAFLNNKRVKVSKISDLKKASISHGSINVFNRERMLNGLIKICDTVQGRRSFSCYGYNLLWKGKLDVVLEPGGGIWDFAAPAIITEEAGGKFTDFNGKFSLTSGNAILTNGLLHKQVLKLLNCE